MMASTARHAIPKRVLLFLLLLLNLLLPQFTYATNVLAVLPSVWRSHYLFGRRLLQQLVDTQQNYSVTLISPHAEEYPVQRNIREIRIEGLRENWEEMGLPFDVEQLRQRSIMERFTRLMYAGTTNVDLLLSNEKVRKLLRSGERFDLLVLDLFLSDSLLGLAHLYETPTVVLCPTGANTWLNHMIGNPQSSALDPSDFLPYTERMNIWQRCINTLMSVFEQLTYNFFHMISQEAVYTKHFQLLSQLAKTNLPHHRELTKNLSLVLMNSHPIIQYPRAYLPNMLEIAGVHLHDAHQIELPLHLEYFIESAPKGVVYISLGADARSVDLAHEKLDTLLDVISYLKDYHFLLKWEEPKFYSILPKNVMIEEWWPQEAILAHPNVKVFISACGLMSIIESINGLTPILAIPIFPEQEVAAQRLQQQGVALMLSFDTIAYDSLLFGINQLSQNKSYTEHITELRRLLHSNYGTALARSVHYIELVLRSANGGAFLKSYANELNFMRAQLLDVLAIIFTGLLVIIAVPFFVTCCILRRSYYNQAALQQTQTTNATHRATLRATGRTNSGSAGACDSPVLEWRRRNSSTKGGSGFGGGGNMIPPSSPTPSASSTTSASASTASTSSSASSVTDSPPSATTTARHTTIKHHNKHD